MTVEAAEEQAAGTKVKLGTIQQQLWNRRDVC